MSPQQLDTMQQAIDEVVATWPDVRAKQVFGHRGYVRNGKMFGFQGDTGVAVKATDGEQSKRLYALDAVVPFVYSGSMEMKAWPVLPLRSDADIETALTAMQEAYDNAG